MERQLLPMARPPGTCTVIAPKDPAQTDTTLTVRTAGPTTSIRVRELALVI